MYIHRSKSLALTDDAIYALVDMTFETCSYTGYTLITVQRTKRAKCLMEEIDTQKHHRRNWNNVQSQMHVTDLRLGDPSFLQGTSLN